MFLLFSLNEVSLYYVNRYDLKLKVVLSDNAFYHLTKPFCQALLGSIIRFHRFLVIEWLWLQIVKTLPLVIDIKFSLLIPQTEPWFSVEHDSRDQKLKATELQMPICRKKKSNLKKIIVIFVFVVLKYNSWRIKYPYYRWDFVVFVTFSIANSTLWLTR